ncbi:MAG: thioredoxin domain-containing protein [Armatimonadota bacterium]|nr:thioredoxin domain-containing protein [Armatimonadota bacterium]MDR7519051.1 thioredoxin domain-containing protein [Armatimonadota bacterium]MDR7549993.1 thioredoxin domain-containing protein [Armatimonadota bacterium]
MTRRRDDRPHRTVLIVVTVAAVGAALAAAGAHWWSASRPAGPGSSPPPGSAPAVEMDGKTLGRPDAPVVIEVYSDFLCSHCADFAREVEPALVREFVAPGIVRLAYRNFPVVAPLSAYLAAAGECAADQQRFWAFHEAAFARTARRAWRGAEDVDATVREAGLDPAAVAACAQRQEIRARVETDFREGTRRGVEGTPTLFVGERRLVGNQPLDVLRAAIRAAQSR